MQGLMQSLSVLLFLEFWVLKNFWSFGIRLALCGLPEFLDIHVSAWSTVLCIPSCRVCAIGISVSYRRSAYKLCAEDCQRWLPNATQTSDIYSCIYIYIYPGLSTLLP